MYKIAKNNGGFTLTFGDVIDRQEMERWYKESERALTLCQGKFGVVIDMRTLRPLAKEVQALMVQGQALFRAKGMQRSAVILNDPVLTCQFSRLARESGIYAFERYLDASADANWQKHAEDWVNSAIDPDKLRS